MVSYGIWFSDPWSSPQWWDDCTGHDGRYTDLNEVYRIMGQRQHAYPRNTYEVRERPRP